MPFIEPEMPGIGVLFVRPKDWANHPNTEHKEACRQNWNSFLMHSKADEFIELVNSEDEFWRDADMPVYRFVNANRGVISRQHYWLIAEWDTYCNVNLRRYYQGYFQPNPVAASVIGLHDHDWDWWKDFRYLPSDLMPRATGVAPFLLLVHAGSLIRISDVAVTVPNVFCELRFGSVAASLSLHPVTFSHNDGKFDWRPLKKEDVKGQGLFHPLKELL